MKKRTNASKAIYKLAVATCLLLGFGSHAASNAAQNIVQDIVIDTAHQRTYIDKPCNQLTITKKATKSTVIINARIQGDVTIEGDSCCIELLDGAEFGENQSWWNWLWSRKNENNCNSFYIKGAHARITACKRRKKTLHSKMFVTGNKASIELSIGGTATITGDDCCIKGSIGGATTVSGDDCRIEGAIGGAAHIEGKRCIVDGAIGGNAVVVGDDCSIEGAIGGSALVEGDNCSINGSVGGSVTVTGKKATIRGSVGGSARIRKDTQFEAIIGGKKTVN
jgi:hypothetical protein